jgi:hypothetical protein
VLLNPRINPLIIHTSKMTRLVINAVGDPNQSVTFLLIRAKRSLNFDIYIKIPQEIEGCERLPMLH